MSTDGPRAAAAPRSTFVTVLAWLSIALSAGGALMTILQAVMLYVMHDLFQLMEQSPRLQAGENLPALMEMTFNHFGLFVAAFFLLCLFWLAASIGLLHRRNWARIAIMVLLGFGIAWNVGAVVWQGYVMSGMVEDLDAQMAAAAEQARQRAESQPGEQAGEPLPASPPDTEAVEKAFRLFSRVMLVFTAIMSFAFSCLFAWLIWKLATPAIRAEFVTEQGP